MFSSNVYLYCCNIKESEAKGERKIIMGFKNKMTGKGLQEKGGRKVKVWGNGRRNVSGERHLKPACK